MNRTIILASTPLHLFGAVAIALQEEQKYHLIYIDQTNTKYYIALIKWRKSPFKNIDILLSDKSSLFKKLKSKRGNIKKLFNIIKDINPDRLIVGNDRKTEISATIAKFKNRVEINYLDDGIHSYILERSSKFKYTIFDSIIRSLIYGKIIYTPKYIGCSSYIKRAYLFKPNLANSCIKEKEIRVLDIDILKSDKIKEFIYSLIDRETKEILTKIETLLFLPHPKELNRDILNILIEKFDNSKVAIKTHPRDRATSNLFKSAKVISKDVPTEALTLILPQNIKIIGFATTALLTAKWLNSSLDIVSIEFNSKNNRLSQLMRKSDIKIERGDKI